MNVLRVVYLTFMIHCRNKKREQKKLISVSKGETQQMSQHVHMLYG